MYLFLYLYKRSDVPSLTTRTLATTVNLASNLLLELAAYYQLTDPDLSRPLLSAPASPCSGYDSLSPDHPVLTPLTPEQAQESHRSLRASIPVAKMSYQINGPLYAFCGTFSGKDSAIRWLRKLEHELSGYKQADGLIPPDKYLDAFNMLLTDDAGDWADSHPNAIRLLNTKEPTKATVDTFKALLCERFPSKAAELTPVPFDVELAELR